ncbi:hypothetical protein [Clostridium paraputrificum]|uniref:hypothetical protein n=1 Tax=Clostridium paraputrificum TaxID=29363 RepID=UPI000C06C883|nr:hypothetical protein [Clostridium paraputrificum]
MIKIDEKLSFLEQSVKENVINQMHKAINKGIIPGAVVIFDGEETYKHIVTSLILGHDNKIEARLMDERGGSYMHWPANSKRLTVVKFYNE